MVKTAWDDSDRHHARVADATIVVTTTEADILGPLTASQLRDVGGLIKGDAAFTAKLMGSMDGTNFVQDGTDVSVTTSYARFEFSERWAVIKIRASTAAGTADADFQMAGFV